MRRSLQWLLTEEGRLVVGKRGADVGAMRSEGGVLTVALKLCATLERKGCAHKLVILAQNR